jgi:hypothetical protein
MLRALLLAAALSSSAARDLVAKVEASITEVRAAQAKLPPPKDDAERLARMGELDQAPRRVITTFDFSTIPDAERIPAQEAASEAIEAVDEANQAALVKLVPAEGWFLKSRYGEAAARAAFNIVQHADGDLQLRFLPVLEPLVAKGEISGASYAMMFDRVAIQADRPQRYGSQFRCDGGRWRPYPIEDPDRLDERRKAMGFPMTFTDYRAIFERMPSCPQTRRPPPRGMKLE